MSGNPRYGKSVLSHPSPQAKSKPTPRGGHIIIYQKVLISCSSLCHFQAFSSAKQGCGARGPPFPTGLLKSHKSQHGYILLYTFLFSMPVFFRRGLLRESIRNVGEFMFELERLLNYWSARSWKWQRTRVYFCWSAG
jgi:hypothetical protein